MNENLAKYKHKPLCGIKSVTVNITDIHGNVSVVDLDVVDLETKANNFMYQTLSNAIGFTLEKHLAKATANVLSFNMLDDYKKGLFTKEQFEMGRYGYHTFGNCVYINHIKYKFSDENDFRHHYDLLNMYIKTTQW